MHLEMTNKICALCNRPVEAGIYADPARLCGECRSLIQTILPSAGSSSAFAVQQAEGMARPQFATARAAQPALAAPMSFEENFDDAEITSPPDRYEITSFDPVTDFDELQPARIVDAETGYLDEFEPGHEAIGQELDVFIMPEQPEEFRHHAAAFEPPSEELHVLNPPLDEAPAQKVGSDQAAETTAQDNFKVETQNNVVALKGADAAADDEVASYSEATDPWDDPLPAWEHSRNEYPLYVGITERKRRFGLKALLVPAALLACLAAAYLILQSFNRGPENEQAVVESGQGNSETPSTAASHQATDPPKPASDEAQQVAPISPDNTVAANTEKNATASSATASDGAETQWRYALQALASQSIEEANALAERMKGAGLPAYVISADIASRGRWFRVRIGGFSTAQEGQRFAAEARARARAAGITLKDLNVVDYVKP